MREADARIRGLEADIQTAAAAKPGAAPAPAPAARRAQSAAAASGGGLAGVNSSPAALDRGGFAGELRREGEEGER